MTDKEWATSQDPRAMLELITPGESRGVGKLKSWMVSDRKVRLFAVACCRQTWDRLSTKCRGGVEVAERHADALTMSSERGKAFNVADDDPSPTQGSLAMACLRAHAVQGAAEIVGLIEEWIPPSIQANLLREIIGNPHNPLPYKWEVRREGRSLVKVTTGPRWQETVDVDWLTPTVVNMARFAYDSRDFSNLPVIADALEEAGCWSLWVCLNCKGEGYVYDWEVAMSGDNGRVPCRNCRSSGHIQNPLLSHLRGKEPHVKGCWAVDCMLGLE